MNSRSDLYIRINVEIPDEVPSSPVSKPSDDPEATEPELRAEDDLMIKDKQLYRKWDIKAELKGSKKKKSKKSKKDEL